MYEDMAEEAAIGADEFPIGSACRPGCRQRQGQSGGAEDLATTKAFIGLVSFGDPSQMGGNVGSSALV